MLHKASSTTQVGIGIGVVIAAILLTVTAGCSATHQDAPQPSNIGNGSNQQVIQEPDGFRNVVFSCFGSNGLYVSSAGSGDSLPSSVYVLANDPHCVGR